MNEGFRWCQHCGKPHQLAERFCDATGKPLDALIHRPPTPRGVAVSPLVGAVLDRKYRILRPIGMGGMGVVFEAENIVLKRLVAVKVVSRPGSQEALARLAREATLVAAIQHPNICDVYDVGQLPSGGPYVVLERLFGGSLAGHMRTTPRPHVHAVVDIFVQVLSGLHAAHAARILHRDLKPQNIFLAERVGCAPIVKIVDFGFAQDLSAVPGIRLTRPGKACGTVQYMSPEQLRAEPLDHRSDLFAVGVMLYEVLTGRHPFAACSQLELQSNILRETARPLRQVRPGISPEIEQIIASAMEKDPSRRPASAFAMQAALSAAVRPQSSPDLEEEPVSTTNPIWIPPASSPPP